MKIETETVTKIILPPADKETFKKVLEKLNIEINQVSFKSGERWDKKESDLIKSIYSELESN